MIESLEQNPNQEKFLELQKILRAKYMEDVLGVNEKVNELIAILTLDNPDLSLDDYQLYHLIIGSSESRDLLDLSGGEIEEFIREL